MAAIMTTPTIKGMDTPFSVDYQGVNYERFEVSKGEYVVIARGISDPELTHVSIASMVSFPVSAEISGEEERIPYPVKEIGMSFAGGNQKLVSVSIASGISTIHNNAFMGCSNLRDINIGESVDSIGSFAFARCSSLTAISFPPSVTRIGESICVENTNLKSVSLGSSTTVPFKAFQRCVSLTSINLVGIRRICQYAFDGCTGLSDIVIPQNVEYIETGAFDDCMNLHSVTFSESTDPIYVNGSVFEPNTLLEVSILRPVIGPSANSIFGQQSRCEVILLGEYASLRHISDFPTRTENPFFSGFTGLKNVDVTSSIPPVIDYPLFEQQTFASARLRVPESAVNSYRQAEYWKQFITIEIGNFADIPYIADEPNLQYFLSDGIITTHGHACLYDMSGRKLYDSHYGRIALPGHGTYILVNSGKSAKIIF